MARIAVTGGLGFIGHEIVEYLLAADHSVTVVDFWQELISHYAEYRFPILTRTYALAGRLERLITPDELLQDVGDYDAIVHAGAVVDTKDLGRGGKLWERNVTYTQRLVRKMNGRQQLTFISSAAVYGEDGTRPNNPYGLSKVLGERIVHEHAGKVTILRLFNVFGSDEHHKGEMASMPFQIACEFRNGRSPRLHSLNACRDFVHVKDVAEAVVKSLSTGRSSEHATFDVGTGVPTSFGFLAETMFEQMNPTTTAELEREGAFVTVPFPMTLSGRYQNFTKAGMYGTPTLLGRPTIERLKETYG